MANRLNAFLAAVPSNALSSPSPSPCAVKTQGVPEGRAFPSLTLPQPTDDEDDDDGTVDINDFARSLNEHLEEEDPSAPRRRRSKHSTPAQPATPQPQRLYKSTHRSLGRRGSSSGHSFQLSPRDDDELAFDPDAEAGSNQNDDEEENGEEGEGRHHQPTTPAKPPLAMSETLAKSAAMRRQSQGQEQDETEAEAVAESTAEAEADPMKRLSVTHQLQQLEQQQQAHRHHRRVSTGTARFSKRMLESPDHAIDAHVLHQFTQLPVPTISRPDSDSTNHSYNSNQLEFALEAEDEDAPEAVLAAFARGELLSVAAALALIKRATDLFALERNVVAISATRTIVGDLHGQFSDLVALFQVHGTPSASNAFLFLGDYVDRGVASCEIMLTLLAFKAARPDHVHLLRGNHECRSLSTFYGFRAECLAKYGLVVYNRMVKCFESLPLAARLRTSYGEFFAVHGGLSPAIKRVDEIDDAVDRFMEPEPSGALCDLLWADPAKDGADEDEEEEEEEEAEEQQHGEEEDAEQRRKTRDHRPAARWRSNVVRGCSYTFNEQVCREFLATNNLLAIIRAHELEEDGFREHFQSHGDTDTENADSTAGDDSCDDSLTRLPPVVTVFSAPEYCNTNHNMGATLVIPWDRPPHNERVLQYRQHTRSAQREKAFTGASEQDAVLAFLATQLPFLPVDFYDLVALCRQVRAALLVASEVEVGHIELHGAWFESDSSLLGPSLTPIQDDDESDRKDDETETEQQPQPQAQPHPQVLPAPAVMVLPSSFTAPVPGKSDPQPRQRSSRMCPGFLRFCEKYLGLNFTSTPKKSKTTKKTEKTAAPRESGGKASTGATKAPAVAVTASHATSGCALSTPSEPSASLQTDKCGIFTTAQWRALRLFYGLLDVAGTGVLMEESFVVLLAEQDSDAYATQDELELLMEVMDCNGDGLITEHDFLQFASRALLRWKKNSRSSSTKLVSASVVAK